MGAGRVSLNTVGLETSSWLLLLLTWPFLLFQIFISSVKKRRCIYLKGNRITFLWTDLHLLSHLKSRQVAIVYLLPNPVLEISIDGYRHKIGRNDLTS